MIINFSELSTQEIREIVADGESVLNERADSAIRQKAQTIATLIDEIYELVSDEGGDPDIDFLNSYDTTLLNIRDAFALLKFKNFQIEE